MNVKLICDIFNFIGFIGLLFILNNSLENIDLYIVYYLLFGILIYTCSRLLNISRLMEIYHYMLSLAFGLIPFITYNKEILIWHLFFIILTIVSRIKLNGCIVRKLEGKNPITDNYFTKMFNWDVIFPLLALTTLTKLYLYHFTLDKSV